jgi:hypothetical protein
MKLRVRTSREMIELNANEAVELRERLRNVPAAQPAEETIAVSANASTSVTFTELQRAAVLDVLDRWIEEVGPAAGEGPVNLRDALRDELAANQ